MRDEQECRAEARRYIKGKSRSLAPESGTRDDGAGAEKPQVSRPKATRHLGYKVGPTPRNEGWGTRKGERQIPSAGIRQSG